MAGSISKSNSGVVTTSTSIVTSWASGSATSGRQLMLITQMSNVISATPTGWTQRASQISNADFKVYTRTADGTATDTPTLTMGSGGGVWLLFEINGVSGIDVVGTSGVGGSNSGSSSAFSATPTAGSRFAVAVDTSQLGSGATWGTPTPSWAAATAGSFVDSGLTVSRNGAGGVNDAERISFATLSATMTAVAQTTTASGVDSSQHSWVMVIYTESASGVTGTMAATEAADTFAGSGSYGPIGTMVATETADAFAASGSYGPRGTMAATEATDTFTGSGSFGAVTGTMAATEAADTFAGSGSYGPIGTMAATETADALAGSGSFTASGASGTMAATEAADTFAATGSTGPRGTLAATEAADAFAGTGTAPVTGVQYLGGMPTGKGKKRHRDPFELPQYIERQLAAEAKAKPAKPAAAVDPNIEIERRRQDDEVLLTLLLMD